LKHNDDPLSDFAFNFNLRRYIKGLLGNSSKKLEVSSPAKYHMDENTIESPEDEESYAMGRLGAGASTRTPDSDSPKPRYTAASAMAKTRRQGRPHNWDLHLPLTGTCNPYNGHLTPLQRGSISLLTSHMSQTHFAKRHRDYFL
jgi:hypothetical protein